MKITKIIIPEYRQFKNFELDLTYPEGHAKAGQPLEKVCFIGQSGTGKTTLLNIVRALRDDKFKIKDLEASIEAKFYMSLDEKNLPYNILLKNTGCEILYDEYLFAKNEGFEIDKMAVVKNIIGFLGSKMPQSKLVYLPAELIDNFNQILANENNNPLTSFKTVDEIEDYIIKREEKLKLKKIFDFSKDNVLDVWAFILRESQAFWNEEIKWKNKIADEVVENIASAEKLIEEYKKWKRENPNPISNIANKINTILNHFQLEIVKDFEYTRVEDLYFVKVQTLNNRKKIPFENWSTGTKQILLNALPLINLDIKDGLILIDEPEHSLFPDIQRQIVDFYTELSPSSQFFFATHSPIIASCFEPWEIVELYFDKKGEVKPRKYYEGKRHIDTYFLDFRYLRWDDILMKGFGMSEEGNSEFREKELMKTARLYKRLIKMRAEGKVQTPEYQASLSEYLASAKKVGWNHEKD
jgi:ABC-type lipoprotein export system ATPase subunit